MENRRITKKVPPDVPVMKVCDGALKEYVIQGFNLDMIQVGTVLEIQSKSELTSFLALVYNVTKTSIQYTYTDCGCTEHETLDIDEVMSGRYMIHQVINTLDKL